MCNINCRQIIICLLILCCLNGSVFAASGSSGWPIFNKIQSTQFRSLSLTSPGYSDVSGILYNPAMAGTLSVRQILFISEIGFADDKLGAVLYGVPSGKGMITLGAGYYDAGSIELNWIENGEIMSENVPLQRDTLALLSYEHPVLTNLYWGVTLKGANSEIAQRSSASAYAGDMGIFYMPAPNLTVSLAVQNIGSSTKFIAKESPLPVSNYIGIGYVWNSSNFYLLTGAGVTNNIQDNTQFPEAGVEIGFGNISLNLGYSSNADEANVHTGVQFVIKNVVVGYAYLPGVYLSPTHRFTIGYQFATSPAAEVQNTARKTAVDSNSRPRYQLRMPMDMAVAQFSANGLSQSNASYIADYLREELAKSVLYDVVDIADMKSTLEAGYFKQPGCSTADSAIEFGKLLNVKQVIMGAVSKSSGIYYLKVNSVNVNAGIIKHAYVEQAASLKLLRAACQGLVKKISDDWALDRKASQPPKKDSKKIKSAK